MTQGKARVVDNKAPRIMVTESNRSVEYQVESCGAVVERAGWSPMAAVRDLATCDGLLITGGGDVNPRLYGATPHKSVYGVSASRDVRELALLGAARTLGIPVLGICRGLQVIAVEAGGTLHQNLPDAIGHDSHSCNMMKVTTVRGSLVNRTLGDLPDMLHLHHQALKKIPAGFQVTARHWDGTVEAIESTDGRVIGVQFHPESVLTQYTTDHTGWMLFDAFVGTCTRYRRRALAKGRIEISDPSRYLEPWPDAVKANNYTPPVKDKRHSSKGSHCPPFKSAADSAAVFEPPRNHGRTKGVLNDYRPVEAWCGPCGIAFDHLKDYEDHQDFFHPMGRRPTFALVQGS